MQVRHVLQGGTQAGLAGWVQPEQEAWGAGQVFLCSLSHFYVAYVLFCSLGLSKLQGGKCSHRIPRNV